MARIMTRIAHAKSLSDYPDGCVFCGHDVGYLSNQAVEPGGEVLFQDRPRERETLAKAYPMCPTCAKGPDAFHHRDCRGCR